MDFGLSSPQNHGSQPLKELSVCVHSCFCFFGTQIRFCPLLCLSWFLYEPSPLLPFCVTYNCIGRMVPQSLLSLEPVSPSKAWGVRTTPLLSNPLHFVLLTHQWWAHIAPLSSWIGTTVFWGCCLLLPQIDFLLVPITSFSLCFLSLWRWNCQQDKTLSVFSCLRLRLMRRWLSLPSLLDLASMPALCKAFKKYYPYTPKIGLPLPSPPARPPQVGICMPVKTCCTLIPLLWLLVLCVTVTCIIWYSFHSQSPFLSPRIRDSQGSES